MGISKLGALRSDDVPLLSSRIPPRRTSNALPQLRSGALGRRSGCDAVEANTPWEVVISRKYPRSITSKSSTPLAAPEPTCDPY